MGKYYCVGAFEILILGLVLWQVIMGEWRAEDGSAWISREEHPIVFWVGIAGELTFAVIVALLFLR